jgi:hypothetical protein
MTYNFSNHDLFAYESEGERHAYTAWLVFVILCSFLGDSTILVASIKYQAFQLHEMVIAFIQHIAVCDLLHSAAISLPTLVSTICHDLSWNGSKVLNYTRFFVSYFIFTVSAFLISALTLSKLLLVKYPFRTQSWTKIHAHGLGLGIWIASLTVPTLHLLVDKDAIIFDYRIHTGTYNYDSDVWKVLLPVMALLAIFAPNIIIVVSSVLLLKEAKGVARGTQESLRWQGIMTVLLTAAVYSLSYLPITVYFIAGPFVKQDSSEPGPFYIEFYRIACAALTINVFANIFVYSLTVASFRSFLRASLQQCYKRLRSRFLPSSHQVVSFLIDHL